MHAAHCQQAAGGPVRETALAPPQTGMWYLRQPYWPCERATAPMERRNRITSLPFHAGGGEEETTHRSRRAVWCGPSLHATCAACCPGRSPAGHRAGAPGTTRTVAEGSRTDSKRGRQRQPPRASARVSPAQGHACGHHPACIAETLPRTRIAHGHRSRDACLVEKNGQGSTRPKWLSVFSSTALAKETGIPHPTLSSILPVWARTPLSWTRLCVLLSLRSQGERRFEGIGGLPQHVPLAVVMQRGLAASSANLVQSKCRGGSSQSNGPDVCAQRSPPKKTKEKTKNRGLIPGGPPNAPVVHHS